MISISASEVAQHSPYPALIAALSRGLLEPIQTPPRSHFNPNADASTVLVMPAWKPHDIMGVKLVSIWPGNNAQGLPAVSGVYVLSSCADGRPLAVLDGTELTLRRTAATAALGAKLLARPASRRLAVLGTGALALPMVLAHSQVFNLTHICIWGRKLDNAHAVVDALAQQGIQAQASTDLQAVLADTDVAVTVTTATQPFIRADWVQPGTHLGLVGAFTPDMAEAEPALMPRARIYADTTEGVLQKGGEVLQAIRAGLIAQSDVRGELAQLLHPTQALAGRATAQDITVFKTVGFAALDLISAELIYKNCGTDLVYGAAETVSSPSD